VLDRFLAGLAAQLVSGRAGWFHRRGIALLLAIGTGPCFLARLTTTSSSMRSPTSHNAVCTTASSMPPLGVQIRFQFLVQTQGQDGIKDPKVLQAVADSASLSRKPSRMSARRNRSPILSSA